MVSYRCGILQIHAIGAVLAVIAIGAILYATVLSRSGSSKEVYLIPFSTFERAKIQPEFYRSVLMNVFLFVPLGMALSLVFGGTTGKRIFFTVLTGLLLPVTAEAIQYFVHLGMAETDDIICNTIGTATGSCAYLLTLFWRKIFKRKKTIEGERMKMLDRQTGLVCVYPTRNYGIDALRIVSMLMVVTLHVLGHGVF